MKCSVRFLLIGLATTVVPIMAQASIVLAFHSVSEFQADTTAMNAALGVGSDTIDTFASMTLLPGLSISLSGGEVPSVTWTNLPSIYDQNTIGCGALGIASWTGATAVVSALNNEPNNCANPTNIAKTTTFEYAPGTTQFGIGLANFQSATPPSPSFPITNHELFVNGVDMGQLETLAGANWNSGIALNSYLVVTGTDGSSITSVAFESLAGLDTVAFSDLAVATPTADGEGGNVNVPEPATLGLLGFGFVALGFVRRSYKS